MQARKQVPFEELQKVGLRLKQITASLFLQCGEFISMMLFCANLYQCCYFVRVLKAFV